MICPTRLDSARKRFCPTRKISAQIHALRSLLTESLAVSFKMEATQMVIFNFLWLTWDHWRSVNFEMSFLVSSILPKKNEKIRIYYYGTSSWIGFFFLGELKTPKRHFDDKWKFSTFYCQLFKKIPIFDTFLPFFTAFVWDTMRHL